MKDKIKDFIISTFMYGEGSLKDDELLFDSGIIDSLGLIKLLSFIEKEFDIQVDMSDITMDNFASVNNIAATINEKKPG